VQPVLADATIEDELDLAEAPAPRSTALPLVLGAAAAGWAGAMLWVARGQLNDPAAWPGIAAGAAAGPILIGLLWLLSFRTSRVEARRFADTGAAMRAEAAQLERTVSRLSVALEANRAALAAHVGTLTATAEEAEDRLTALTRAVGDQAARADEHARSLAQAAEAGHAGVTALLTALPRAQAGVEDATGALDDAGRHAGERAAALAAQLELLSAKAREADALAEGAAQALGMQADRADQASRAAGARLEAASGAAADAVDELFLRTDRKLEEAQHRLGTRSDEVLALLQHSQDALEQGARGSAENLASRVAEIEAVIGRVSDRLEAQRASGDLMVESLRGGIADVEGQLETLHAQGSERTQLLAASISALGGSADAMTEALRAGDTMASRTIGTTETLLIALDSAAREIDETLPHALARLDARVTDSRHVVAEAKPELLGLVTAAESTHDAIEAIAGVIADQRKLLETLSGTLLETLSTGRARADALGQVVDEAAERTRVFADDAAPRMASALNVVRDAAADAAAQAKNALASVVPEAVSALAAASGDAMRRAAADSVERQVRSLAAAAKVAEDTAARAGQRVAAEVEALVRQAQSVDAHVATVRSEREAAERDAGSRRAATLIEAMQSAAIDVTRALSTDVADSIWAAYLKGDRGVFTRRAVRLLDEGTADRVAALYDADETFRDGTNRYIHDFEAMLRQVLSQPEGTALSITLLSSDMGKLYVALAQGIERLR